MQLLEIGFGHFPPRCLDCNQQFFTCIVLLSTWICGPNEFTPYILNNVRVGRLRWPGKNINVIVHKPLLSQFWPVNGGIVLLKCPCHSQCFGRKRQKIILQCLAICCGVLRAIQNGKLTHTIVRNCTPNHDTFTTPLTFFEELFFPVICHASSTLNHLARLSWTLSHQKRWISSNSLLPIHWQPLPNSPIPYDVFRTFEVFAASCLIEDTDSCLVFFGSAAPWREVSDHIRAEQLTVCLYMPPELVNSCLRCSAIP